MISATPLVRLLFSKGHVGFEDRPRAIRRLLSQYDVSETSLAQEGARIPHELSFELLVRSAFLLRSDAIALHALGHWKLGDHGISDYLNASCATVRQLLDTITEFVGLLHDGVLLTVVAAGSTTLLNCTLDPDVAYDKWWMESCLGKVVVELRRAFAPLPLPAVRGVRFSHSAPSYEHEYTPIFQVPVAFDQGHDALEFDTQLLDTPMPTGAPVLHGLLRRQALGMRPLPRAERSFLDWVQFVVRQELPISGGSQVRIAERLGVSSTTLRRRLSVEHGTTYGELLENIRRQVAAQQLAESSIPAGDVAYRTGFTARTSFYRAFKRWYHCTPLEYRRLHESR